MKLHPYIISLLFILLLSSCNRKKELVCNDELKFIVSTKYDWFEDHESYYYELQTKSGPNLISTSWFLARERNGVKLSEFSCAENDSLVLLFWHNDYILAAYNLNKSHELSYDELLILQSQYK